MALVPSPKKITDPSSWSELELYAATVLLEAESETDTGKLGVAWVIRTRMDLDKKGWDRYLPGTVHATVLKRLQFSCWNDDYAGQRKARLTAPDPNIWARCWWAAAAALWKLVPDPTGGSAHYYNPRLANPEWANAATGRITIDNHVFLQGVA